MHASLKISHKYDATWFSKSRALVDLRCQINPIAENRVSIIQKLTKSVYLQYELLINILFRNINIKIR